VEDPSEIGKSEENCKISSY